MFNQLYINKQLWKICENFRDRTEIKQNYIEYISVLLILKYCCEDEYFKYILSNKNNFYIGDYIDQKKQEFCEEIQDRDIFSNINFRDIKYFRDIGEKNIISITIEDIYDLSSMANTREKIAEAYEYILEQSLYRDGISKGIGEFHTPKEITDVIANLLIYKDNLKIYDPICGSGNLLISAAKNFKSEIFGKEKNLDYYNILKTRLLLNDIDSQNVILDNKKIDENFQVDIALANPPFADKTWKTNSELKNKKFNEILYQTTVGDYYYVLKMLESLKEDGKMAIILPHGVLFRENEKEIRKQLINLNYIETIIGLPENLFYGTRMAVIIMILCKNKKDENILFIDASKDYENDKKNNILTQEYQEKIIDTYKRREDIENYSHLATKKEIIENKFDLTIKKYLYKKMQLEIVDKEKLIKHVTDLKLEQENIEENIKDVLEVLGYKDILDIQNENNKIGQTVKDYKEDKKQEELSYLVIGENIRRIRKEKNYTMEKLAEKLDVSVMFLSRIERGISYPRFKTLWNICKALDISVVELFKC